MKLSRKIRRKRAQLNPGWIDGGFAELWARIRRRQMLQQVLRELRAEWERDN
jgi:hypothetical protein